MRAAGNSSFPVWVELVCGGCGARLLGRFTRLRFINRRDMKTEAHRAGWRVDTVHSLLCRKCSRAADRQGEVVLAAPPIDSDRLLGAASRYKAARR